MTHVKLPQYKLEMLQSITRERIIDGRNSL
jgi:hypothetical protein